jgi:hypothetical protein
MGIGDARQRLYGYICFEVNEGAVHIVHVLCWASDFGVRGGASLLLRELLRTYPKHRFTTRLQMNRQRNQSWEVSRLFNVFVSNGFTVRYTEWDTPNLLRFFLRRELQTIQED